MRIGDPGTVGYIDGLETGKVTERVKLGRLISGGLIPTYCCSSACGHCLYNCKVTNRRKGLLTFPVRTWQRFRLPTMMVVMR